MSVRLITVVLLAGIGFGCGGKEEECMTDADCADGQTCVTSHDHEGDDHDHGGTCEDPDTAD